MRITHHSQWMLLITAFAGLIFHIVSGTTIDFDSLCSGDSVNFCVLTNLTASYDDPLVISNTTTILKLRELTIRMSAVGRIPTQLLKQSPELESITIYNCALNRITSNDFENTARVRKLVIQMNRLFDVPQQAFAAMNATLEELYLGYNTIHIVNRKAFTALANLQYLDLQHNNIWSLYAGIFDDLVNLKHIDLSHNKIDKIDAETFAKNNKLATILLQGNLFSVFEPNSLEHLTHLHYLDLSNTVLEEIRVQSVDLMFVQSSGLKRCTISGGIIQLNASNNALEAVNLVDKYLVRHIDLHDNQLKTLDDFVGMVNLQTLDVSYNQLVSLRTSQSPTCLPLPSLIQLNAAHNHLVNITLDDLLQLPKLTTLDLSFNKLMHLGAEIFEPLISLEKLYIEGNRLHQFDFVELKRNNEFLHEIGLYLNPWDSQKLQSMLTFLQEHDVVLPNRVDPMKTSDTTIRDADVTKFITPAKMTELHQLTGVTGIHPYWTMRDILSLITLLIVLFILLLQFFRILQEEQCFQRRRNRGHGESEPLRSGHHQRLVEDNSPV